MGDGVAAVAAGASSAPVLSDFGLGDDYSVSTPNDPDRCLIEDGAFSTPNGSDFEYDHPFGDESFTFDINDFITDEHVPSTEQQPMFPSFSHAPAPSSLFNSETQVSSEDSYLQPHSGASLDGCDDGGIAVSVV